MAGQIFKLLLGLTVTILLTCMCEVKANGFSELLKALQFSFIDEPDHHIRQKRADSYTDYTAEIEINATNASVIDEIQNYLKTIQNTQVDNMTLLETNFTTVCSLVGTGYQCTCEDHYFWPCDKCSEYGSCSARNDTCSCIKGFVREQYCTTTTYPACTQPPTALTPTTYAPAKIIYAPTTQASTAYAPAPTIYVMYMSLTLNVPYQTSLINPEDPIYKQKASKIQTAIENSYGKLPKYKINSTKVIGFRSGSVIVDYMINVTDNNIDLTSANIDLSDILNREGFNVDPNAFAQTVQENLSSTTNPVYPSERMTLSCPQFVDGATTWRVNEKEPDPTKYTFSANKRTLTLNNATESDSGRYSCNIIKNSANYIQWQDIEIKKQAQIDLKGEDVRIFPCETQVIDLECCETAGYNIEWVLDGISIKSGSGCISIKHSTVSGSCGDKIFTCRLKDLTQLYRFSYSARRVTITTKAEVFDCKSETFGFGKTGDITEGPCPKGKEGSITYLCKSSIWTVKQDNCVVTVIKELNTASQTLEVKEIPQFVENLSNAAKEKEDVITQSAANVQSIVEILNTVAEISESKNITINKPVIENFLATVNIITSAESTNTWEELNKDNQTQGNTSTDLLRSIETISNHLSNENLVITNPSIQLNRNITEGSNKDYKVKSQLTDSTTEILIPNVPKLTSITIIILTNIGDFLPTRNNNSGTSDNQINGDVVVVQVKPPMNNIVLTFDIKNTSLGNPQCVFWNFTLDRWDSTGCRVKSAGNDNVSCECSHTTSFSILMSPFAEEIFSPEKRLALAYITYIGVAISMISLILCLIIEIIVWKQVTRNDTSYMRHVSIVNIAVSLLIANICFMIGAAIAYPYEKLEETVKEERCSPVVFFMHFFYLAVFFWMLISALLLLYRTTVVLSQMSRTVMMSIAFTVGYCAPLLIAVITVASTAGPQNYVSEKNACWLNLNESRALLAFVIPALTIVFINLLILIVVVCKILRRGVGTSAQPSERHILIVIARCVAFLTPIFGLTWGFGIGTMVSTDFGIHVVFAFLNSLQGFFVLLFGILLDGKVREALARTLSLTNLSSIVTRSTNAGTSSSSGLGIFQRLRRNVYNISNPNTSRTANSSDASESLNP